jgi:PAS domain-containing protein
MRSSDNTPHPGGGEGSWTPVTLDALIWPAGLRQYPLGVVIFDTKLRIVWANGAAGRLGDRLPATAWPGRRLGEVLPHLNAASIERSLRRVLATGKPVAGVEVSSHASGDTGGERFWSCIQFRIDGLDGKAAGVAHVMREVTERVRNQRRLGGG